MEYRQARGLGSEVVQRKEMLSGILRREEHRECCTAPRADVRCISGGAGTRRVTDSNLINFIKGFKSVLPKCQGHSDSDSVTELSSYAGEKTSTTNKEHSNNEIDYWKRSLVESTDTFCDYCDSLNDSNFVENNCSEISKNTCSIIKPHCVSSKHNHKQTHRLTRDISDRLTDSHSSSRPTFVHVFTSLLLLNFGVTVQAHRGFDMCEPIEIPMCAGMRYNMTRMPNHLHHSTQENARLAIEPFGELVKQNCSADILFFLCAMFAPICTPHFQKEAIPPCRSVCESSKRGCEPVLNKYNISWPSALDCNALPEYDKGVCVSPEAIVSSMPEDNTTEKNKEEEHKPRHKPRKDCRCPNRQKPSRKAYSSGKYNYAIGAEVDSITILNETTSVVSVNVKEILERDKVHIQDNRPMLLWVDSDCVCPSLRPNRKYLIIGHEEVMLNRLKFTEDSLVTRWQPKWEKKFKKWSAVKLRKKNKKGKGGKKRRCKKNPNSKACRKKPNRRVKCRIEQKDEVKTRYRCKHRTKGTDRKDRKNKKKNLLKKIVTNDTDTNRVTVTNKAGR